MNESITNTSTEFEKIDVISFLRDVLHRLRRLWWIVLLLIAGSMLLSYYRSAVRYSPTYVAEATVSVEIVNGGMSANRNTAEQMGAIFPYILTSGALSDVIAADLGMKSVPGSIRVNSISGTNLLTISVTSSSAENAYHILQSMLRNYPTVAQYVVGQTELTIIDEGGIPAESGRTAVIRSSLVRGAAIGAFLGIVLLIVYSATFRTIRSETELRSLMNVSCLGTLPFCQRKRRRKSNRTEINILRDTQQTAYIDSMRLIRTRLERQMEGKKVLMVTSSISGEGKSTVAANLAISMALRGKKVILVDCDLRSPSLAQIFGLAEKYPGLISVLRGSCALDDTLYEVPNRGEPFGLTLLPGGAKESKLVEILGSEAMNATIEELKKRADIVILDTPPSAMLVDAMMLVRHVDSLVYVVMCDFARRRVILNGVKELSASNAPIVGCILNGGSTRSGGYGYYGYRGRYGYGYGYGYGSGNYGGASGARKGSSSKSSGRRSSASDSPASGQKEKSPPDKAEGSSQDRQRTKRR